MRSTLLSRHSRVLWSAASTLFRGREATRDFCSGHKAGLLNKESLYGLSRVMLSSVIHVAVGDRCVAWAYSVF